jgi:hypothetical protein
MKRIDYGMGCWGGGQRENSRKKTALRSRTKIKIEVLRFCEFSCFEREWIADDLAGA